MGKSSQKTDIKGLWITLIFMGMLIPMVCFQFFGIPALQKELFHLKNIRFVEYQTSFGPFAVIGFFAYAMLVIIIITYIFKEQKGSRKVAVILIASTIALSLAGNVEMLLSFKYATPEGIAMHWWHEKNIRHYSWNSVKKVSIKLERESSSSKYYANKTYVMLRWKLTMTDGMTMKFEDVATGDFPLLKNIYARLPLNADEFEVRKKNLDYWNSLKAVHFSERITDPDARIVPPGPF